MFRVHKLEIWKNKYIYICQYVQKNSINYKVCTKQVKKFIPVHFKSSENVQGCKI